MEEQVESLINCMKEVIGLIDIPEKNCSCPLGHPPCSDCVENSAIREAVERFETKRDQYRKLCLENKTRLRSIE